MWMCPKWYTLPGECRVLSTFCQQERKTKEFNKVDRDGFPCGCMVGRCGNAAGRRSFNSARVRHHFFKTMYRLRCQGNGNDWKISKFAYNFETVSHVYFHQELNLNRHRRPTRPRYRLTSPSSPSALATSPNPRTIMEPYFGPNSGPREVLGLQPIKWVGNHESQPVVYRELSL